MFPPSSVEPGLVAPLDPKEFIQRILVPEVAVRLIMEDRKTRGATGFNEAVQVLRDSAAYGVAMFPDDGSGGSNTGGEKSRKGRTQESDKSGSTALDEMLQEKARKRRKEIEEEEVEIVQREDRKKPARRKATAPASEPQIPPTQPERARPRPKPKTRGKSPTRVDGASSGVSEAECDSVFGDTEDMCLDGLSDADRAAWDELNDLQAELSMDFNFDQNRPSREDNAPRIPLPPSPTGSLASNSSSKPKRRAAERANSKIISISSGTDSDEDDWSIAGNKTRSKGKRRGASRAPSVSLEQAVDGDETPKPSRPRPKPKPKGQECEPQTTTMAKARRHLAKGGSGRDEWSRTMRDGNPSPPTSPSRSKWLLSDDSQSQSSQSRL
ncbi:hypothetical protein PQX77_015052 [Marasmius sp. AFHP31]|nr:hypothetical protein PQX77_015052 [Marasmius sp. AFHP31]